MSTQVYTLSAASPKLPSTGLGFEARSVMVTNYTDQYVRVDGTGLDVPPFVFGTVLSLPPGTRSAKASLIATTPTVTGPPLSNANATLTYVDAALPPDPGQLLAQSQFNMTRLLGTVVDNGTTTTKDFTIPAGSQTIRVVPDGGQRAQGIIVTGKTSQSNYLFIPTPSIAVVYAAPIDPSIDPVVTVTFQGGGIGNQTLYVGISLAAEAVQVVAPPGEELAVNITKVNSNVGTGQDLTPTAANSLAVVPAEFYKPAPWQSPSAGASFNFGNPAATGTTTLIAAVAGKSIYLHAMSWFWTPAVAGVTGDFQDSAGTIVPLHDGAVTTNARYMDFKGLQLGVGLGFQWRESGAAAANSAFCLGGISYSQA